jgi:phasin family protein
MNKARGCRSLQDFVRLHTEIARDVPGKLMESSRRVAEISAQATGGAAQLIQSQAGNSVELNKSVIPLWPVA